MIEVLFGAAGLGALLLLAALAMPVLLIVGVWWLVARGMQGKGRRSGCSLCGYTSHEARDCPQRARTEHDSP